MRKGRHRDIVILAGALALASPVAARADPYDRMAKILTRGQKGLAGQKGAVMPFSYADGRASPGGTVVSEALAAAVAARGQMALVESNLLRRAAEEITLSGTGLAASESSLKAGALAGAKFLVVGTLIDAGPKRVDVRARLIQTETGAVLSAVQARVKKTWKDADEPIRDEGGRAAVLEVKSVALPRADAEDAVLVRVASRRLAARYSNSGGIPVVRVTDYTGPEPVETDEVEVPYDAAGNRIASFSAKIRLAGRSYRLWYDAASPYSAEKGPAIRIAPTKGFFGGGVEEGEERLVEFSGLLMRWTRDIERRGHYLGEAGGTAYVAYFEALPRRRLGVSIWAVRREADGANRLQAAPRDRLELTGKPRKKVSSRVMTVGPRHFRFRYDLGEASVAVEELK